MEKRASALDNKNDVNYKKELVDFFRLFEGLKRVLHWVLIGSLQAKTKLNTMI